MRRGRAVGATRARVAVIRRDVSCRWRRQCAGLQRRGVQIRVKMIIVRAIAMLGTAGAPPLPPLGSLGLLRT